MGMLMHHHLMAQRAKEAEAGKVEAPDESDRERVTKPRKRRGTRGQAQRPTENPAEGTGPTAGPAPEDDNTEQSDQD